MVREEYHDELAKMQQKVLRFGELTKAAIKDSVESLRDHDERKAEAIIIGDVDIDRLFSEIENDCMQLLALQQPMANDLRMIISVIKINIDLERTCDLAVAIAKIAIATKNEEHIKPLIDIPRMAQIACEMLNSAMIAFRESDSVLAYMTAVRDDEIDALFDQVRRELITLMVEDPKRIANASHLRFAVRYLERIGDHINNICESVVYMVTGDRVKLN